MGNGNQYDLYKKNRAITSFGLRVFVAAYILYIVWKILSGTFQGSSPIPVGAALLIGGIFVLAAILFIVYSWKQFRGAMKAALLTDEAAPEENGQ